MSEVLYSDQDYLEALQNLLPQGAAWPRDPDSVMTATLQGFADSQSTTQGREANLLIDAFPSTTVELITEWEQSLGPDPCLGLAPTLQQRQLSIVARLIGGGGQNIAYLESVAAALGFPGVTISEYAAYRCGMDFGLPMYSEAWAYALLIQNFVFPIQYFKFGANTCGEPFAVWGTSVLICELRRLMPGHMILLFQFLTS